MPINLYDLHLDNNRLPPELGRHLGRYLNRSEASYRIEGNDAIIQYDVITNNNTQISYKEYYSYRIGRSGRLYLGELTEILKFIKKGNKKITTSYIPSPYPNEWHVEKLTEYVNRNGSIKRKIKRYTTNNSYVNELHTSHTFAPLPQAPDQYIDIEYGYNNGRLINMTRRLSSGDDILGDQILLHNGLPDIDYAGHVVLSDMLSSENEPLRYRGRLGEQFQHRYRVELPVNLLRPTSREFEIETGRNPERELSRRYRFLNNVITGEYNPL